jgi:hypothetical protein
MLLRLTLLGLLVLATASSLFLGAGPEPAPTDAVGLAVRKTPSPTRGTGGGGGGGGGDSNNVSFDNDNFDFDNDNAFDSDFSAPPPVATYEPAVVTVTELCAQPGQAATLASGDGRISVRIPPTLPRAVKVRLRTSLDQTAYPWPPGPRVGALLVELTAEGCDGGALAALPAELGLTMGYSDLDAVGLQEPAFTISRLDPLAAAWSPLAQQAVDVIANTASGGVLEPGVYTLHERGCC